MSLDERKFISASYHYELFKSLFYRNVYIFFYIWLLHKLFFKRNLNSKNFKTNFNSSKKIRHRIVSSKI